MTQNETSPGTSAHRPGTVRRFRGSLLPKILGVIVAVVLVSGAIIFTLDTNLTRGELERQAREMLANDLETLTVAGVSDASDLVTRLRTAGQGALHGAHAPDRHAELVTELGRVRRELGLDLLNVFGPKGEVDVAIGGQLRPLPPAALLELEAAPLARLVHTADGGHAHVALVSMGIGDERIVLAGGHRFDDAAAYRMRGLIRHDVLLVADRHLAGSSLTQRLRQPPLVGEDGKLPEKPAMITLGGQDLLVGYAPLTAAAGPWAPRAAVGVVLPDPVASLDRSLGRIRVAMSVLFLIVAAGLSWALFRRLTRPLLALSDTAQRVEAGDLDASFQVHSHDEIGQLAGSLEEMRRDLRHQVELITHQSRALRESSQRIVSAHDDERRRLAADLHDGLQRRLVMLRLQAGTLAGLLEKEPEQAGRATRALATEIEGVLEELREISHALYPSILTDRGLDGALHSLGARAPITVEIITDPDPLPRLWPEVEANAYFLLSEALANVLKHADASRVVIQLKLTDQTLRVRVTDDGKGLDPEDIRKTGGLTHMRDRAWATGGTMNVTTGADGGTQVEATFQTRPAEEPERRSVGRTLEVEEHGRDTPVDVEVLVETELGEDAADVLLHRPLRDD